jgi:hypothetical protein
MIEYYKISTRVFNAQLVLLQASSGQNTHPYPKRWPWPLYVASKHMCVEMKDRRTAPAFHNYPRSLNLDADVPDLERREKHNLTALKGEKAIGLSTGTLGNLKYIGKK